jgi:hypothetical protein
MMGKTLRYQQKLEGKTKKARICFNWWKVQMLEVTVTANSQIKLSQFLTQFV